jgi:transposase
LDSKNTIMSNILFAHYERLLRLGSDWSVTDVRVDDVHDTLHIYVIYNKNYWSDPTSGEMIKIHDLRSDRVWRHLDSMEHCTFIHCRLPRIRTSGGHYRTISADWAEAGFSHTKKFENKCVLTLQSTYCQKAAATLMDISDDKMCSIMHNSVQRGLSERDISQIDQISIDEKSYAKGHVYISVLSDSKTGTVLDIVKDRTESAATTLINKVFDTDQLFQIKATCCDMWDAYINTLKKTAQMPSWFMINFTLSSI